MGNHGESWGIMNRNFIIQIDKLLRYLENYLVKIQFMHNLSVIMIIQPHLVGLTYYSGMMIMGVLVI